MRQQVSDEYPRWERCAEQSAEARPVGLYPRPTNGIFEAITVMNSTLASSGSVAM